MAKKKSEMYNENYIHSCNCKKMQLVPAKRALSDLTADELRTEDFMKIMDFYVLKSPRLKDTKEKNHDFFTRCLQSMGWSGNQGLGKLEALLKKEADLELILICSESIENTLKATELDADKICVEHARGVLKQDFSLSTNEKGQISFSEKEKRMVCLFRHIRNSLAHGNTYYFSNGFILLEDHDEKGNITARLLISLQSLINWIDIINNPPKKENQNGKTNK